MVQYPHVIGVELVRWWQRWQESVGEEDELSLLQLSRLPQGSCFVFPLVFLPKIRLSYHFLIPLESTRKSLLCLLSNHFLQYTYMVC